MVNNKYRRFAIVALLCMICVCGCKRKDKIQDESLKTPAEKVTVTAIPTQEVVLTKELVPSIKGIDDMKELSIYSIDSESAEKKSITAMISNEKEITPAMIVDKVVESIADETYTIGIDSVTTQDDIVIVSFLDDQPPVTNVGSSVEGEILDAIAQSLLDNLEDYHKVIFRVMGGPYQSGHIELELNTIYMESK